MAVELRISDGNPWWLSPDVWVVPGDNPEGTPGTPVTGQNAFLWARVMNDGRSNVTNATVRFYWANPAAGFDRSTANLVGTSFVNLAAGATAEVLCLTPWVPMFVNNGHECILAEAFHEPLDPLPVANEFAVPTDRHVAQRNLSVVQAKRGVFVMMAMFYNTGRTDRTFTLRITPGKMDQLASLAKTLGVTPPDRDGRLARVSFTDERCPDPEHALAKPQDHVHVRIPAFASVAKTIVGQIEGPGVLFHVAQNIEQDEYCGKRSPSQVVGGLSILVVDAYKENKR